MANQRGSSCESLWGGPGTGISFPPYYKPTKDMGSASAFYPTSEELDRKEMRVTLVARGGRGAAQPRAGAARARQHGRRPRPGVPGARIGAPGPWRPAGRSRAGGVGTRADRGVHRPWHASGAAGGDRASAWFGASGAGGGRRAAHRAGAGGPVVAPHRAVAAGDRPRAVRFDQHRQDAHPGHLPQARGRRPRRGGRPRPRVRPGARVEGVDR